MDRAMPGTSFGHISALDGVRGIAISLVLLHHANVLTSGAGGSVGVSLFFVLSGFLISSLLIAERTSTGYIQLGRFYVRRATRLLPAFALLLVTSAAILLLIGEPWEALRTSAGAGSYIGNWLMAQGGEWFGPMSHSWSLAIEEQFYLVWPILLIALWPLLSRYGVVVLLAVAIVVTALRPLLAASGVPGDRIMFGTDTQGDGLLIGCAIAFWYRNPPRAKPWWLGAVGMASILAVAWLAPFAMWSLEGGQSLAVMGSGLLVVAAVTRRDRLTTRILDNKTLRYLGRISYSAYLWHYPLMWHAGVIDAKPSAMSFVAIGASLALAAASYVLVERPVLRWRERRSRRVLSGSGAGVVGAMEPISQAAILRFEPVVDRPADPAALGR